MIMTRRKTEICAMLLFAGSVFVCTLHAEFSAVSGKETPAASAEMNGTKKRNPQAVQQTSPERMCDYEKELRELENKIKLADEQIQDARYQGDYNFAYANMMKVKQEYLNVIFEKKLFATSDHQRHQELIREFGHLHSEISKINNAPTEGTGTGESMFRSSNCIYWLDYFHTVWTLPPEKEKIWRNISHTCWNEKLQDLSGFIYGHATITCKPYDCEEKLIISLQMKDVFEFNGKIFALCPIGMEGTVNDDYASLALVVFKGNQVVAIQQVKDYEVYIYNYSLKNNILTVMGTNDVQYTFDLNKF